MTMNQLNFDENLRHYASRAQGSILAVVDTLVPDQMARREIRKMVLDQIDLFRLRVQEEAKAHGIHEN